MSQQANYKDKTTATMLALFLGAIGAHLIYLGKTERGLIYAALGLIGMYYIMDSQSIIPMSIVALMGLIDSGIIFSMEDQKFNEEYNPTPVKIEKRDSFTSSSSTTQTIENGQINENLIECRVCHKLIARTAIKCVHCGGDNSSKAVQVLDLIKLIIILFMIYQGVSFYLKHY